MLRFRPLDSWPRERRSSHDRSPFSATWISTVELLERELTQLGASNGVILVDCSELDIRLDGTYPKADARVGYPGVVVAFDSTHGPLKYVADRFRAWQDNVRAIALGLEALRKVDRYGITSRGEQYTGWAALPAGEGSGPSTFAEAVAFVAEHSGSTEEQVTASPRTAWLVAAKRLHPDQGGDADLFRQLQRARELLNIDQERSA